MFLNCFYNKDYKEDACASTSFNKAIFAQYYADAGWEYSEAEKHTQAFKWFKRGAELGNRTAMGNLAWSYRYGHGVEKNYSEALRWYRKAASQGSLYSQTGVGDMYFYGLGVSQSYTTAKSWYLKAANKDYVGAQKAMGWYYVKQDNLDKALKWYRKAAAQGDKEAKERISDINLFQGAQAIKSWFGGGSSSSDYDSYSSDDTYECYKYIRQSGHEDFYGYEELEIHVVDCKGSRFGVKEYFYVPSPTQGKKAGYYEHLSTTFTGQPYLSPNKTEALKKLCGCD